MFGRRWFAMLAAPAFADGVADAKALIAKYSKLPTFDAAGSGLRRRGLHEGQEDCSRFR